MNDKNVIEYALKRLAKFLNLQESTIMNLAKKHGIIEKRKRSILCFPFLFTLFHTMFSGSLRHKDRAQVYYKMFDTKVSDNSISDRLSQIPPAFFQDILKLIEPRLKHLGNSSNRKSLNKIINYIMIEDASVFQVNKRLIGKLGKSAGRGKNVSMKLFLSLDIYNGDKVNAVVKSGKGHDSKHVSKMEGKGLELRDRAWFKINYFINLFKQGKYFISRIKDNFDPFIINSSESGMQGKYLQDIDWNNFEGEVHLKVVKSDSKGKFYETKPGNLFELDMFGKSHEGQWYWYIAYLPAIEALNFETIHQLYRLRWRVEELFREIKSLLGSNALKNLSHPNCIENQIYIAVITWIALRGMCNKIAKANRLSEHGFRLDRIMVGAYKESLLEYITFILVNENVTYAKIKRLTEHWARKIYSKLSALSKRHCQLGMAIANLQDA